VKTLARCAPNSKSSCGNGCGMVVRPEALRERIAGLRAACSRLSDVGMRTATDPATEWARERGLQIAAQAVFDIGNHILSGGFAERPADYAAIPAMLCRKGVIGVDLEGRLRGLAGFRNLLVHDYARVDPVRVREMLEARLPDLVAFADAVEDWLSREAEPNEKG
jgi:uncharacterized protein YutE (UPF0331/DUF86 family)